MREKSGPDRRPRVVSAAAACGVVLALLGALGGYAYVYLSTATDDAPADVMLAVLGLGLIVAAVPMIVGALGLLRRRVWARVVLTAAVVVSVPLAALGNEPAMLPGPMFVELVGAAVVLVLAWTPAASRWLRRADVRSGPDVSAPAT